MQKLIFREEQSFRQSFVVWLLAFVWLLTMGIFGYGLYQQLYLGKPFGDNPTSDNMLIIISVLIVGMMTAILLFFLNSTLITEIWSDGIRYKFPPIIRRTRQIILHDISSASVMKYNPVLEFGGWGWRKRLLSRKTAYSVTGSIGLRITLKSGHQIVIGTQKQEEMKRAVTKMLELDIAKTQLDA